MATTSSLLGVPLEMHPTSGFVTHVIFMHLAPNYPTKAIRVPNNVCLKITCFSNLQIKIFRNELVNYLCVEQYI